MSSGVDPAQRSSLRAMAHPLRLRMMSLLTGAPMCAAEVARELDITHANASYHLRQLHDAGLLVVAEEESVRGGKARRYRYDIDAPGVSSPDSDSAALYYQALAGELVRRSAARRDGAERGASSDAELWVPPDAWIAAVQAVSEAIAALHRAARPPREPGTRHVSVTTAMFEMGDDE